MSGDARARISEGTSEHHVDPYAFATLGMWMLLHDLAPRFTLAWYVHGQVTTGEMVARWNTLSRLYRALRDGPRDAPRSHRKAVDATNVCS